jgi:hypothetical protein
MDTLSKKEKREILGKKMLLSDDNGIYAKLIYKNGIKSFDELLSGKNQNEINAKTHIVKFPKGIEIRLAKLSGSMLKQELILAQTIRIINYSRKNMIL